MPVFDFVCPTCGKVIEVFRHSYKDAPSCCDALMSRKWDMDSLVIKMGYPGWVDRLEDVGKRQNDRGQRRTYVHPSVIGAN
jgi:hypothetical protein